MFGPKTCPRSFDGLRDVQMKQALRLAKPKTLVDALAQALEFETVKKASKNEGRVREVKAENDSGPEFLDDLVKKVLNNNEQGESTKMLEFRGNRPP